jgi:hypothetical protein
VKRNYDFFMWTVGLTNSVLVSPVNNGNDRRLSNNKVSQTQEIKT